MTQPPVTDLDDEHCDLAHRVRAGVLSASVTGPGPDLGAIISAGTRRRRRRGGAQAVAVALAGAAVTVATLTALPDRDSTLSAASTPPTTSHAADDVLTDMGEPAARKGLTALPDLEPDPTGSAVVDEGTGRYLGSDDIAQYWAAKTTRSELCFIVDIIAEDLTGAQCGVPTDIFLEQGQAGALTGPGTNLQYIFVPPNYDSTRLQAQRYEPVLPNVLTKP